MGLTDFFSDLYASLTITEVHAEARSGAGEGGNDQGDAQTSGGAMNEDKDQGTGKSATAQQSGMAGVKGGVSTKTPAAGTNEESGEEAEVNKQDFNKIGRGDSEEQGHKPGTETGKSAAGQEGVSDRVKENKAAATGGDEDEEPTEEEQPEEEEEEEEEEEPVDPKPKLEEECANSKECAPIKHHYDECAARVTRQIDEEGKAKEDCVEEFFHLAHCASNCAAPKLFRQLR